MLCLAKDQEVENKGWEVMENGLEYQIVQKGEGEPVKEKDKVSVHYKGTLVDGTQFDSSYDRKKPFEFTVGAGMVIKGWDLGVLGMKIGEKRILNIPSELGYGKRGIGPIPPDSDLIFEIELLGIN
jgi:FKBP-type peptidyl-prolyl cis-trans isomerase